MKYKNIIKFLFKNYSFYSKNNLSEKRDGAYIAYLDKFESVGIQWIALYLNAENVTYLDSFGVENISKEIRKLIKDRCIITNIYRIHAYDSIMCEFIYFMLKGEIWLEYTNLFSPNDYERNNKK